MSQDDRIEVQFGAKTSELDRGAAQAQAAVRDFAKTTSDAGKTTESTWAGVGTLFEGVSQIIRGALGRSTEDIETFGKIAKTALSGVGSGIGALPAIVGGVTAAAAGAGVALFALGKKGIDTADEMNDLSQRIGISVEDLAGYKLAAESSGTSLEGMATGVKRLSVYLTEHGDKLRAAGITATTADGAMRQLADRFQQMPDGATKTAVAMELMGRSGADMIPLLNGGGAALGQMIQRGKELYPVTTEMAQASDALNDQLQEVKLALESVSIRVGKMLLPVLTDMAKAWQANVEQIGAANAALVTLGQTGVIGQTISVLWANVSYVFEQVGREIGGIAAQMVALAHGDFRGAGVIGDEMKADAEKARKEVDALTDRILNFQNIKKSLPASVADYGNAQEPAGKGGFDALFAKKQKDETRMKEWEAELAEQKLHVQEMARAEGSFREMSLAEEAAFWQKKLSLTNLSEKERVALRQKYATAARAADKQAFDAAMEEGRAEIAFYKNNLDAKLVLEQRQAEKMKAAYGEESKEYAAARREVLAVERAIQAQLLQIQQIHRDSAKDAALAQVDEEEADAQTRVRIGEMTNNQLIQLEQVFEMRRNAILRDALADRLLIAESDPDRNVEEIARLNAEKEALERQHQSKLAAIRRQDAEVNYAVWQDLSSRMSGLWDKGVEAMMNGTLRWRNALKAIGTEAVGWFANSVIKPMVADWLIGENTKSAATALGERLRAALGLQGAATTTEAKAGEATAVVSANAAEAASGAASSQASIPYVGPILAIAAMGTILAAVTGLAGGIKSAAGGFDIPSGMNPVTQLHEEEMVLPKGIANPLRKMLAGGGGNPDGDGPSGGGGGGGGQVIYNDHSGRLSRATIRENARIIAEELNRTHRDGWRPK
jgi:hypothetical protein